MPTFKEKLADPTCRLTSHIVTIPSAIVTQAMAAAGADSVIVDLEHGAVDFGTAHAMIAATAGTDCAPLVRVSEVDEAQVKRVLDLGAEGIVFPLIRTADDACKAVATMQYPPNGIRGFGPFIAHSRYGQSMIEYAQTFHDRGVCVLLAETIEAVENIADICAVPGIDAIVVAAFDLSVCLGLPGQFDHPDFVEAAAKIETAAQVAGIPIGGVALSAEHAQQQFDKGYRLIAGFDVLWIKARTAEMQSWCDT